MIRWALDQGRDALRRLLVGSGRTKPLTEPARLDSGMPQWPAKEVVLSV